MVVFNFEYYLSEGLVKRKRRDFSLAKSMINAAKDRFDFARSILKEKPYALENAYEAVIEAIDALLALNGFKSWSHEANISFLRNFEFKSKYYGVEFSFHEAKEEVEFLDGIFKKVMSIVERKLKSRQ